MSEAITGDRLRRLPDGGRIVARDRHGREIEIERRDWAGCHAFTVYRDGKRVSSKNMLLAAAVVDAWAEDLEAARTDFLLTAGTKPVE